MMQATRPTSPGVPRGHAFRVSRWTIRTRLLVLVLAVVFISGAALLGATIAVWEAGTPHVLASAPPGLPVGVVLPPGIRSPAGLIIRTTNLVHSEDSHQLLVAAGAAFAMMAALSLGLGWLLAGRFLAPLRTITAATKRISATNLHERLDLAGPDDELKELADTFDQLLDRLERSFSFERRFVANASHELRTPLAAMRTSLDVAMAKPGPAPPHMRALADRLRRELDHADRLLESFLTLARAQQGSPADETTVSFAGLARRAIEHHADAIAQKRMTVTQEPHADVWVSGSETLLSRMVENVIDNAIVHNEPGGWVRVAVETQDEYARLIVENGGPQLDADQVEQLGQPFRRIGAERTGSDKGAGLGLSIVAAIAEVHNGTLALAAGQGGGLRVVITLPVASATNGDPA
jgi:signal transduction histidine kinase